MLIHPSHGFLYIILYFIVRNSVNGINTTFTNDTVPHCASFLDYCNFNPATASCTFTDSIAFTCEKGQNNSTNALTSDCRWELSGDIILAPNVTITITSSFLSDACTLHLSIGNRVIFQPYSHLSVASISMDASFVRLEAYTTLSASFYGFYHGKSALFPGNNEKGASFGGSGGLVRVLDESSNSSSYFDVHSLPTSIKQGNTSIALWDLEQLWKATEPVNIHPKMSLHLFGSPSIMNNSRIIPGGGRIRIVASRDLVLMEHAQIQANGHDASDGIAGGSGGSIFLSANAIALSSSSRIQAIGGNASCEEKACLPAGGGGRIHIDYVSSRLQDEAVSTSGGGILASRLNLSGMDGAALHGSSGTYYRVIKTLTESDSTSLKETRLLIRGSPFLNGTNLKAITQVDIGNTTSRVDSLVIDAGAVVQSRELEINGDTTIQNYSTLLSFYPLQWNAQDITLSQYARLLFPKTDVEIHAKSIVLDNSVQVSFLTRLIMQTTRRLYNDASIQSVHGVLSLQGRNGVVIGGTGITVGSLYLSSSLGSIQIQTSTPLLAMQPADSQALFQPCPNTQPSTVDTNYTMVLYAHQSITLGTYEYNQTMLKPHVVLRSSAMLLCANQGTIRIADDVVVSASGMGAQANQGPGSGDCVESVGGGGGYGGRGADSVGDYGSGGLEYGSRTGLGLLGSGGGCVDGGAGGGVVAIGAKTLSLNGSVVCNGVGGVNGGGGGSGGFLGLSIAESLQGHGQISAVGGGAQCFVQDQKNQTVVCGGGGAGGRLQLHGCEQGLIDQCTSGFEGNYTVAGGSIASPLSINTTETYGMAASSGSFFGFPCLPGYGGLFCRLCHIGMYKTESNSEECMMCTNAPEHAHYIAIKDDLPSTSSECPWACDPGYSGGSVCISPLQQLFNACGGTLGFILILISIVFFFISLGYACRNRSPHPSNFRKPTNETDSDRHERQALLSSTISTSKLYKLTWFYWPQVAYPKLQERELSQHMARLYFNGLNERDQPLELRRTVPSSLQNVLYETEFRLLADRINQVLMWPRPWYTCTNWEEWIYLIVALLCYPYATSVLNYQRHIRMNALKRLIAKYNHACMKGPRARGLLNALKVGYASDYSLVYLEILFKESVQSTCIPTGPSHMIGKPSLPLVLLFAGRGTYFSPFYLDPSDLLVRSVPQCPQLTSFIDDLWIEFVAELNALLRVVSYHEELMIQTLLPVAQFLEQTRKTSKMGGLQIHLGRFYVDWDDEKIDGQEFKLGIYLMSTEQKEPVLKHPLVPLKESSLPSPRYYGTNGYEMDDLNETNSSTGSGMYPYPSSSTTPLRNGGNENIPVGRRSIREEALLSNTNDTLVVKDSEHPPPSRRQPNNKWSVFSRSIHSNSRTSRPISAFYKSWRGSIDTSLPLPGILISTNELYGRLTQRTPLQIARARLIQYIFPRNVPLTWHSSITSTKRVGTVPTAWTLNLSLLLLLMIDLAITFAMLVNLQCVSNGEIDYSCSISILVPVLLIPPCTLLLAPIMGIISLAISSTSFTRRYAVWNGLSMINIGVAMIICMFHSSRLVSPWFTAPLPLLPAIAMMVKAGEAYVIERYIAYQETNRTRRGWRGLMKRRLSDASIQLESP